jgi:hypothetical protein
VLGLVSHFYPEFAVTMHKDDPREMGGSVSQ